MKKAILLCKTETEETKELAGFFPEAEWAIVHSADDAIVKHEEMGEVDVIFVDTPSEIGQMEKLTDSIRHGNNYVFATAVLLVTDEEHLEKDAEYLGGIVVDIIRKPLRKQIVVNRVKNAMDTVSNVSFSEFAKMLKALPANIYLKDGTGRYVFSSQTWHHLNTGDDPNWTIKGKTDLDIRKDRENAKKAMESDLKIIESGVGTS